jgi:hypothetical protein
METHPSSIHRAVGFTLLLIPFLSLSVTARKFYDDDPLKQEPPPLRADKVGQRRISDAYDLFSNTLSKRGERATKQKAIPPPRREYAR